MALEKETIKWHLLGQGRHLADGVMEEHWDCLWVCSWWRWLDREIPGCLLTLSSKPLWWVRPSSWDFRAKKATLHPFRAESAMVPRHRVPHLHLRLACEQRSGEPYPEPNTVFNTGVSCSTVSTATVTQSQHPTSQSLGRGSQS